MKNPYDTIRTLSVPIEWVFAETGSIKKEVSMIDYASSDFKNIIEGNVKGPSDVSFLKYYSETLEKHNRGKKQQIAENKFRNIMQLKDRGEQCDYEFESPATLDANGKFRLLDGHNRTALAIAKGKKEITLNIKHVSPLWLEA